MDIIVDELTEVNVHMKRLLILVVLFLLCSGCTETASPGDEPGGEPHETEEAVTDPVEPRSELCHAVDWGLDGDIVLDEMLKTVDNGNGTTTVYLMYPSKWPYEYIADSIPEYPGRGYMYMLISTAPSLYSTQPEKSEVVTLSIYQYSEKEVSLFADDLIQFGFSETPATEYPEDVQYALDNNMIDGFSKYTTEKCTVQLVLNHDELGDFLQITVLLHDRINARNG